MGRWILFSLLSFPLTILLIVGILLAVKPRSKAPADPQAQNVPHKVEKKLIKKVTSHDIRVGNMTHVKHTLDSLLTVVDFYRDSLGHQAIKMDSLSKAIKSLQSEKEALTKKADSWEKKYKKASGQQMEAKAIARTLSSLKPKEMGKILAKMDDHAIILIYSQMSNVARSTLMAALNSDRAATITQKMLKR